MHGIRLTLPATSPTPHTPTPHIPVSLPSATLLTSQLLAYSLFFHSHLLFNAGSDTQFPALFLSSPPPRPLLLGLISHCRNMFVIKITVIGYSGLNFICKLFIFEYNSFTNLFT